jgi:hypothetical protein
MVPSAWVPSPAEKPAGRSDQSSQNELKTIAVFKKLGYGVVRPEVDVLTFNRWIDQRLRPKEGEHAAKVVNLRFFHRSQCRALTKEEKAEFAEKAKGRSSTEGDRYPAQSTIRLSAINALI